MQLDQKHQSKNEPKASGIFSFIILRCFWICFLLVAGSWLAYFSGKYFWAAEVLTHFRLQYLVAGSIGILLGILNRKFLSTFLLLCFTIPHGIHIGQYYIPQQSKASSISASTNPPPLKILSLNVLEGNRQHQETLDLIVQSNADIVVVVEFSETWVRAIKEKLTKTYPYSTYATGRIWHGNYVFSKIPLKPATSRTTFQKQEDWEIVDAAIFNWHGQEILIIPAHPASPINPTRLRFRTWAIGLYRQMAEASDIPFIFAGDFNCSSGSPYFQDLVDGDLVRDSRYGFGWQGTWPEFFPLALIPIDHILISKHWTVLDRKVKKATGSDHSPITATLQLSN